MQQAYNEFYVYKCISIARYELQLIMIPSIYRILSNISTGYDLWTNYCQIFYIESNDSNLKIQWWHDHTS